MFFWLKKSVSFWLMPLPLCLVLVVLGVWGWRKSKTPRRGRRLIGAGLLLLALCSNGLVSELLVRPLEERYPALPELGSNATPPAALARCQFVVVLGGGNGNSPALPALSQLSTSALGRITEGVRVLRALPHARLIVSGPGPLGELTHAETLARAAISLGVDPSRLVRIETARDTEDEAEEVRRIVGQAPVALVTSAWHMPRAMALFRHAGVNALPCPTDYLLKSRPARLGAAFSFGPENLERTTSAWRERVGQLWIGLRGKS
jgi:uncharacterized SAM-binding protein YcdF (DUF218 family)